jgi:hypothetical protein
MRMCVYVDVCLRVDVDVCDNGCGCMHIQCGWKYMCMCAWKHVDVHVHGAMWVYVDACLHVDVDVCACGCGCM